MWQFCILFSSLLLTYTLTLLQLLYFTLNDDTFHHLCLVLCLSHLSPTSQMLSHCQYYEEVKLLHTTSLSSAGNQRKPKPYPPSYHPTNQVHATPLLLRQAGVHWVTERSPSLLNLLRSRYVNFERKQNRSTCATVLTEHTAWVTSARISIFNTTRHSPHPGSFCRKNLGVAAT